MQQYYTLDQAAQILRTTPDELKEMARKKEVRAFQDRTGWRFRAQEIDELARARGYGSDPELPLGEAAKTKDAGVFNFSLESDESDEVPIGKEPLGTDRPSRTPSGSRKAPGSKSPAPGSKSPPPKQSSDSDVRLVLEGGDMNFIIEDASKPPSSKGPASPPPKTGSSKSPRPTGPAKEDSGVRIVPLDRPSDSDVKIVPSSPHDSSAPIAGQPSKRPSDSDIRIEEVTNPGSRDQMVTEEIDLDAEQRKAEAAAKSKKTKHRPKTQQASPPVLPTSSPFELSESDMDRPTVPPAPRTPEEAEGETDSSSDFDLKPMGDSSPLELGSDELPVMKGDDEVNLGELTGAKGGSGINLQDPADSGISLEQGGSDEIEFELSLDSGSAPKTPAPAPAASTPDSSSEFELSVQGDDSSPTDGSSSEFELSLDPGASSDLAVDEGSSDLVLEKAGSDSDSEFELTLDESGGLSVEEDSGSSGEKDIFETDFEVPPLDEESGSEAVALDEADTDLESSEFDLSLEGGEESGSQVVPLEDEEADEGAATVQRPAVRAPAKGEEGLEDIGEALDEDLDREPALEEEEAVEAAPAAPAEWGVMVPVVSLFSTIILFLVGLMSFELMHGMWGYHRGTKVSNLVIHPIAKMFSGDDKLPDE